MTQKKVDVVEAIIKNKLGEILLLKRSEENKYEIGKWQLPGGKVEENEDYLKAINREVVEEIGCPSEEIKIRKIFPFKSKRHNWQGIINIMVFEGIICDDIKLSNDHVDFKFVEKSNIKKEDLTMISKISIFD
jgi:8-oxo-dGTP diphosphatase